MNEPLPNAYTAAPIDILDSNGNIAIGTESVGGDNIILGSNSGEDITTGADNIIIGHESCKTMTTGQRNIVLGKSSALYSANPSDKLYIDSTDTANPLIGGDFAARTLTFHAEEAKLAGGSTLPNSDNAIATKAYVDNYAQGLIVYEPVAYKTTAALTAAYDNGVDGTGATLTITNAGLTLDAYALVAGVDEGIRVLVADQTDPIENGIYVVSQIGNVAADTVLTRSSDLNGSPDHEVKVGVYVNVLNGDQFTGTGWTLSTRQSLLANPPVISMDDGANEPLVWVMFRGSAVNLGGTLESLQAITYPPADNLFITSAGGDWESTTADTAISRLALNTDGFIEGDGTAAAPIQLTDGTASGDIIQWDGAAWGTTQLPSIPFDQFDAVVGSGEAFTTVQAALTAGHRSILVRSSTTEADDITFTENTYIYILKNVTITAGSLVFNWGTDLVSICVEGEQNSSSQITLTNATSLNNSAIFMTNNKIYNIELSNLLFNSPNIAITFGSNNMQHIKYTQCIFNRSGLTNTAVFNYGNFFKCIFYRCQANAGEGDSNARITFNSCILLDCWLHAFNRNMEDNSNGVCPARFSTCSIDKLTVFSAIPTLKLIFSVNTSVNDLIYYFTSSASAFIVINNSSIKHIKNKIGGISFVVSFRETPLKAIISDIISNNAITFSAGATDCIIKNINSSSLGLSGNLTRVQVSDVRCNDITLSTYTNCVFNNLIATTISSNSNTGYRSAFNNCDASFNFSTGGGSESSFSNIRGGLSSVNSVNSARVRWVNCTFTNNSSVIASGSTSNTNHWLISNCTFNLEFTISGGTNIFIDNCIFHGSMTLNGSSLAIDNINFSNCQFGAATNTWSGTITNCHVNNCRGITNIAGFAGIANLAVVDARGNS
jgi:hypothetical protein